MSDKKNIDRLFQEKLKDFEVTPNNSVWNNIATGLPSDKKGVKGIPIWWRVAGVAATLLLLFTFSQLLLNDKSTTPSQDTIVNEDSIKENLNNDLEDIINIENNDLEEKSPSEKLKLNITDNNTSTQTEKHNLINKVESANAIVTAKTQNDNISNVLKNKLIPSSGKIKNTVADNTNSNLTQEKGLNNNIDKAKRGELLSYSSNSKTEDIKVGINLTAFNVILNTFGLLDTSLIIKEDKLSLIEEIAANEKDLVDDEDFERWYASSNIAPVYFNTLGKGSSIHPQFNNNSKSGNINMSYGISGSYAINKKLSVRAGVNKVALGYSTNNVIVFNSIGASNNTQLLRNIDLNESGQNLSFISATEFNFLQVPSVLSHVVESSIDQKLGFIEIPLELKYNISNKKMGFNIIGGFSALLLNDNEIYSVVNGNSTLLGKATNINNTSFSANFGFGLDFKITDKINLNMEPVFKYQLNTFNDTSGNFKPFIIGIYSGLNFKF